MRINKYMKLYKYIPESHLKSCLSGAISCMPLTHYRNIENIIKQDQLEGVDFCIDPSHPKITLNIIDEKTNQKIDISGMQRLNATSISEDIPFVTCFSTKLSQELKERFKAHYIIEYDSEEIVDKLSQSSQAMCVNIKCGNVRYDTLQNTINDKGSCAINPTLKGFPMSH